MLEPTAALEFFERFRCRDIVDNGFNRLLKRGILTVVRLEREVDSVLTDQPLGFFLILLIHHNRMSAVDLGQLHARNICKSVTYVYHIPERYPSFVLRSIFIKVRIICHIENALVYPEEILGLLREVHGSLGPYCDAIVVIKEFPFGEIKGIYIVKIIEKLCIALIVN